MAHLWLHRIVVSIPDCLSGGRGSIPRGVAIEVLLWNKLKTQVIAECNMYTRTDKMVVIALVIS